MTLSAERVSLRVSGEEHEEWTSIRVARGLEQAAASFELDFAGSTARGARVGRVRPGSPCEVRLGADRVVTGYVDALTARHSATELSWSCSGRSRTADLVDCSATARPGQWRNQTVLQIAQALAATYEVGVVADVDVGAPVPSHALQDGETVYESIERLARVRGLLVTDDELGRLVLTRASAGASVAELRVPGDVLSVELSADASALYTDYVCRGQRAGSDHDFGAPAAHATGAASDAALGRVRTLLLTAEGQADAASCTARARWEAAARLGRSLSVLATVPGWRRPGGRMWRPNERVRVVDPQIEIDGELLVVEVEYSLDEAGSTTTLSLAPPGAYLPEPVAVTARRVAGVWAELAGGVR